MQVEECEDYGRIVLPDVVDLINAPEFKQALKSLYEQGYNTIKVDCTNLEMIDSAGLGSLVLFQKKFKERGGELKLVNVCTSYIKHLLHMIDLERVISIEYLNE